MKPSIRLMADYQCWPLWHCRSVQVGNIDPREVGVSMALAKDLSRWVETFESHMDLSDPASTKWTPEEIAQFDSEGRELSRRLVAEIGDRFDILYQIPFTADEVPVTISK